MKTWRPKGWEEIKKRDYVEDYNPHYGIGYERGADAMLEALRKRGNCERQLGKDGDLVFIPEDKD